MINAHPTHWQEPRTKTHWKSVHRGPLSAQCWPRLGKKAKARSTSVLPSQGKEPTGTLLTSLPHPVEPGWTSLRDSDSLPQTTMPRSWSWQNRKKANYEDEDVGKGNKALRLGSQPSCLLADSQGCQHWQNQEYQGGNSAFPKAANQTLTQQIRWASSKSGYLQQ